MSSFMISLNGISPNPVSLGVKASTYRLGGGHNSVYTAQCYLEQKT